jgi:hypothetical protein
MSLRYLPEHAENALLALELARKEAAHLQYTHRTLFALPIDEAWVLRNLLEREYNMADAGLFLQALLAAREAAEMLFHTVTAIEAEAIAIKLNETSP